MPDNLYRRGRTWWGRVQVAGREYRRSLRTRSRTEAKGRLAAMLQEVSHAAFYGENRHTWQEAILRYTSEVLHQWVKPETAAR